MLLMAMFSEHDQNYLRELILNDDHPKPFINAFVKFQILQSQKHRGSIWLGGLKGEPKSLSDEITNKPIPKGLDWMEKINRSFEQLINGEVKA